MVHSWTATKQNRPEVFDISTKVALLHDKRTKVAREQLSTIGSTKSLMTGCAAEPTRRTRLPPADAWSSVVGSTPSISRSARCCSGTPCASAATTSSSTSSDGLPPLLHFDYETVLDGRKLRAAGQLRAGAHRAAGGRARSTRSGGPTSSSIRAPATARASAASRTTRRSAWRCATGHPVYFVIFFRDPEPGQTLLDVCAAEQQFVRRCASCIRRARSRRSSATARAAGRR